MSSLNKVILIGKLGKDPEQKTFSNGGIVVNFSVATSERWTDKATGEKKEKTEWHNITVWNTRLQDVATKYLSKGSNVYIEGALETRKWQDKDGNDRYTTEVVLKQYRGELVILDGKKSSDEPAEAGEPAKANGYQPQPTQMDDDIPFSFILPILGLLSSVTIF